MKRASVDRNPPGGVKRTDFSSRGEDLNRVSEFSIVLALSGALGAEKRHVPRVIRVFSRL